MSFKNAMMIQPSSRLASVATARLRSTPCHRRRHTSTAATTVSNDTRILATQKWLDTIVIGQKLCPFAPSVRSAPQLRLRVSSSVNEDTLVKEVAVEARILVGKDNRSEKYHPRPETTLLVLNEDIYPEMSDFRNLVKASWRLQAESLVDKAMDIEYSGCSLTMVARLPCCCSAGRVVQRTSRKSASSITSISNQASP